MSYNLFLDDTRDPVDVGNYMLPVELRKQYRLEHWIVVRNYGEFVYQIKHNGLPDKVSFDHDLGEDVAVQAFLDGVSKKKARNLKKLCASGYDCAKWLSVYCIKTKQKFPEYYVHSMNPVGAENILNFIKNHLKYEQTRSL